MDIFPFRYFILEIIHVFNPVQFLLVDTPGCYYHFIILFFECIFIPEITDCFHKFIHPAIVHYLTFGEIFRSHIGCFSVGLLMEVWQSVRVLSVFKQTDRLVGCQVYVEFAGGGLDGEPLDGSEFVFVDVCFDTRLAAAEVVPVQFGQREVDPSHLAVAQEVLEFSQCEISARVRLHLVLLA